MSAIILLLGASLSVAALFLGAFIWSVRHHQFDDGFSPPRRILFDDHQPVSSDTPLNGPQARVRRTDINDTLNQN